MKALGLLIVVLIVAIGIDANTSDFRARLPGPDEEIDRLAMHEYADRLRQEQQRRELELARAAHQQYQQEPEALSVGSESNGESFGAAYHPELGHRFHRPQYPPQQQTQPQGSLRGGHLRHNGIHPHLTLLPKQQPVQTETENNEVKEAMVLKESTKPVLGGGEGKVITVEKVDPVIEQEEEKIPQEELHPTPAYHQARQNNGLSPIQNGANMADVYFLAVVAGCSVAGFVGLVVAGVCWYRLQKNVKAASEAEYPAYGITGPTKEHIQSPGDRKLAQSAQMYHYQHQKQQMIALEKANSEMKQDGSDEDSEEENEEGDYTVYECPGLAPTGEMEVKNPLFSEDTPVTPTMPTNK